MKNQNFNTILSEALTKFNRTTNADRFRSMTDEEMAEIMASDCPPKVECRRLDCSKCWLDWLREEAK